MQPNLSHSRFTAPMTPEQIEQADTQEIAQALNYVPFSVRDALDGITFDAHDLAACKADPLLTDELGVANKQNHDRWILSDEQRAKFKDFTAKTNPTDSDYQDLLASGLKTWHIDASTSIDDIKSMVEYQVFLSDELSAYNRDPAAYQKAKSLDLDLEQAFLDMQVGSEISKAAKGVEDEGLATLDDEVEADVESYFAAQPHMSSSIKSQLAPKLRAKIKAQKEAALTTKVNAAKSLRKQAINTHLAGKRGIDGVKHLNALLGQERTNQSKDAAVAQALEALSKAQAAHQLAKNNLDAKNDEIEAWQSEQRHEALNNILGSEESRYLWRYLTSDENKVRFMRMQDVRFAILLSRGQDDEDYREMTDSERSKLTIIATELSEALTTFHFAGADGYRIPEGERSPQEGSILRSIEWLCGEPQQYAPGTTRTIIPRIDQPVLDRYLRSVKSLRQAHNGKLDAPQKVQLRNSFHGVITNQNLDKLLKLEDKLDASGRIPDPSDVITSASDMNKLQEEVNDSQIVLKGASLAASLHLVNKQGVQGSSSDLSALRNIIGHNIPTMSVNDVLSFLLTHNVISFTRKAGATTYDYLITMPSDQIVNLARSLA